MLRNLLQELVHDALKQDFDCFLRADRRLRILARQGRRNGRDHRRLRMQVKTFEVRVSKEP